MTLLEQVVEVMADHGETVHMSKIAKMLVERFPNVSTPTDQVALSIVSGSGSLK